MKSKDFNDAVGCYSRSLDLYPDEPASYCNRALAYLKLKEYARVIDDANAALNLKSDYLKAYHRRAKAYLALNKIEIAIKDF
jgi:tetratricopeptide (TPR) repeat protein